LFGTRILRPESRWNVKSARNLLLLVSANITGD
jgi:hypothetical protein